jgi:hypothetical protein
LDELKLRFACDLYRDSPKLSLYLPMPLRQWMIYVSAGDYGAVLESYEHILKVNLLIAILYIFLSVSLEDWRI